MWENCVIEMLEWRHQKWRFVKNCFMNAWHIANLTTLQENTMKKMNVLVVMLSLMMVFSTLSCFAATQTETKDKPVVAETKASDTKVAKPSTAAAMEAVNINTADEAALVKIKGIGPKKAAAIIAYRKEKGNFKSIEEIRKVKGIGPKIFEKIKPGLTI
jgi:competence protein ComEA